MKIHEYKEHYIIPFVEYPNKTGGICDKDGNLIINSIRGCGVWGKEDKYDGKLENFNSISTPTIFMGHFTNHYGHFLWETMVRFWIFIDFDRTFFKDKDLVFIDFVDAPCNMYEYPVFNYILNALNIKNYSFNKVTTIQKYDTLYLPDQFSETILELYKKDHDNRYEDIQKKLELINKDIQKKLFYSITKNISGTLKPDLKIYISRDRKSERSSYIYDELFYNLGFKVILPSSNTFEQDLEYYKCARIIAGIDGSGLHNVGFMQNPKRHMIELKHRKDTFLEGNKGLANGQYYFNWFSDTPYTVIPCFKLSFEDSKIILENLLKTI